TCSLRATTCRCSASCTRTPSPGSPRKARRWASRTWPPVRWCVPPTTPTSRHTARRSADQLRQQKKAIPGSPFSFLAVGLPAPRFPPQALEQRGAGKAVRCQAVIQLEGADRLATVGTDDAVRLAQRVTQQIQVLLQLDALGPRQGTLMVGAAGRNLAVAAQAAGERADGRRIGVGVVVLEAGPEGGQGQERRPQAGGRQQQDAFLIAVLGRQGGMDIPSSCHSRNGL